MIQTRIIMGMPILVSINDDSVNEKDFEEIFSYFEKVDQTFSTYKETSEISKLNKEKITKNELSAEVIEVLKLCEQTRIETNGYFNIKIGNIIDPSGLVKGWAIRNAFNILKKKGYKHFYIDAGGDIQTSGKFSLGIVNPFDFKSFAKVLLVNDKAIATSGIYTKGMHIYNPITKQNADELISLTVIGDDILNADRFATAAFAMGTRGIDFIESLKGFEGYAILKDTAIPTSHFNAYVLKKN